MNPKTKLLLTATCLLGLQGCTRVDLGTDQFDLSPPEANRLIRGTWYKEEYVSRGSEARRHPIKYEFLDDGHFRYHESGDNRTTYNGKWKLSGSQLEQIWNGMDGLEGKTVTSSIFILTKSRLDLENLKKGRNTFYRNPKFKYIPKEIFD